MSTIPPSSKGAPSKVPEAHTPRLSGSLVKKNTNNVCPSTLSSLGDPNQSLSSQLVAMKEPPEVIGVGNSATVYALNASLALKQQFEPVDKEVTFAKLLEYCQKKGYIAHDTPFVPVLQADSMQNDDADDVKTSYMFTMPRMKTTFEKYLKEHKGSVPPVMEAEIVQVNRHIDALAAQGFSILDTHHSNILLDDNEKPHLSDFSCCYIAKDSPAERWFNEFALEQKEYGYEKRATILENVMRQHVKL